VAASLPKWFALFCVLVSLLGSLATTASSQQQDSDKNSAATPKAAAKQAQAPKSPTPDEELQQAIDSAGNDRAALVRNLEAFLKKYPQAHQRTRIYRALVEACLQLRDSARAMQYAERIVALSPEDMSITLLTIQLLERNGDEAGIRRASNYASRVLEFIERNSADKSPRVSKEQWRASGIATACRCCWCAVASI